MWEDNIEMDISEIIVELTGLYRFVIRSNADVYESGNQFRSPTEKHEGLRSVEWFSRFYLHLMLQRFLFYSFQAHMKFPPDYPYSPPSIRFLTKVWHPNVYEVSGTC